MRADESGITVHDLWERIRRRVADALGQLGIDEAVEPVQPPSPEFGHLGFPVFKFARVLRRAPDVIARQVAERIETDDLVSKVVTLKGFVNFFLNEETLGKVLLREILEKGDGFAAGGFREDFRSLVEYSAPNTNKPLHLGHIRNNLLGLAVCRTLSYYGHDVVRVNLINDRGVHICKTMLAYQRWGEGKTPEGTGRKGDHMVGDLYVRFDREFKKEYDGWKERTGGDLDEDEFFNTASELGGEVRRLLTAWEAGDEEVLGLWRRMNDWVLEGFDRTYSRMGCEFDVVQYESETYKLGKSLVHQGLESGIFTRRDDGAVVLDLAGVGGEGEKVLLRKDGTSLYMTQDIGTAMTRLDNYSPDRLIYVVGDEQIYHFNLLFKILDLLRPGTGESCHHLAYGMVRLPEGKMKSREGKVVDADDLMDELKELARRELVQRAGEGREHHEGMSAEELDMRAERIAQGALKFFIFRFTPPKSFEYNPEQSIDFNGQTGPYCMYTYARTRSLIRKGGGEPVFDPDLVPLLAETAEKDLIRMLFEFPNVIARSALSLDPSKISEYAFHLAATFARMFTDRNNYPIVTCPDEQLRKARLMLAAAVGVTVRSALGLLGIETLEEM